MDRFCDGGNLFNRLLSQCTLSENHVAKIMRQILSAVEYCHRRGIVQRYSFQSSPSSDLKPENVLFEKEDIDSTVKVIDFGRSKILKPNEKLVEFAGSV